MALELPALPYAYDALGPYMSKETLEFHHDKHHQAYVTNGNNLLKDSPLASASIEEICKKAFAEKNAGLVNNVGQHYNHIHFWNWMKPNGGGKKMPACPAQGDRQRPRRLRQVPHRFHRRGHDAVRLRLGLAFGQGRQARNLQDAERREPAGARRIADPRLSTCGNTATTSTIATRARSIWKRLSTTSSTGITSRKCIPRRNSRTRILRGPACGRAPQDEGHMSSSP